MVKVRVGQIYQSNPPMSSIFCITEVNNFLVTGNLVTLKEYALAYPNSPLMITWNIQELYQLILLDETFCEET